MFQDRRGWNVPGFLVLVLLGGCPKGEGDAAGHDAGETAWCIPGEQRACACPNGTVGVWTCLEGGQVFGVCAGCANSSSRLVNGSSAASSGVPSSGVASHSGSRAGTSASFVASGATSRAVTGSSTSAATGFSSSSSGSPETLRILPAATPIVVDGVAEAAWAQAITAVPGHLVFGSAASPADFSGSFALLWDATYLYVWVDITDGTLKTDSQQQLGMDDTLELYLDLGGNGGSVYDTNTLHIQVREGDLAVMVPGGAVANMVVHGIRGATGRTLELAIPWVSLPPLTQTNSALGFDLRLDDDDDGGDVDAILFWHGVDTRADVSPASFGRAQLVGCTPGMILPRQALWFWPSAPITVDGDVEPAWAHQVVYAVATQVVGTAPLDPADLSARFGLLWDDAALYIMVEVQDDVRQADSLATALHKDDTVEIFLDMDGNLSPALDAHDYHYLIRAQDSAMQEVAHQALAGVAAIMKDIPGGYRLEMAIPFSVVGPPAQVMGLEVAVDDDDDGGDRDAMITWSSPGPGGTLTNTSQWGTVTWGPCLVR